MADENKTKEEEVDSQVEENEDEGLAEALGLGDDDSDSADSEVSEDAASEEPAGEDGEDDEQDATDEDASEEKELVDAAVSEEGDVVAVYDDKEEDKEDESEEAEASFVTPEPAEDEVAEEEDDWPLDEGAEPSEPSEVEEDEDEIEQEDVPVPAVTSSDDASADGLAAYFDDPHELLHAAEEARDEGFEVWDAFSPFPIHGIEDAMGIGRSWLPWVTFGAGGTGFLLANALQFGTLTFDWPMIIGGKPHAPWPSFVPIMFELTVLIGGVTSALVMFIASGCFRKPKIIDPEITNDRFVLWIDSKDPKYGQAREFMNRLDPVEIRTVTF